MNGVPKAPPLTPEDDGSALVAGTVRLDELGQHFDLDFSHQDVDSVSGLILALLGRPPVPGDTVTHDRIRLTLAGSEGRPLSQPATARKRWQSVTSTVTTIWTSRWPTGALPTSRCTSEVPARPSARASEPVRRP